MNGSLPPDTIYRKIKYLNVLLLSHPMHIISISASLRNGNLLDLKFLKSITSWFKFVWKLLGFILGVVIYHPGPEKAHFGPSSSNKLQGPYIYFVGGSSIVLNNPNVYLRCITKMCPSRRRIELQSYPLARCNRMGVSISSAIIEAPEWRNEFDEN